MSQISICKIGHAKIDVGGCQKENLQIFFPFDATANAQLSP